MSMSKKNFIALADLVQALPMAEDQAAIEYMGAKWIRADVLKRRLADFCASQNPRFNRERWLAYIAGECGPNGGAVKGGAK